MKETLGQGGGGQVWAALDRATDSLVAVKILHLGGSQAELDALVRETLALGGLEGLGFPRVLGLGRTHDGRLYQVRELVEGTGLDAVREQRPESYLSLVCQVAEALTVVHRSGLLHGDVKPENAIVRADGRVSLVDLGLSTALAEGGAPSLGLTPHYAAPEVLAGGPLSVQSEVYALGVMVRDLLDDHTSGHSELSRSEARKVAARALEVEPSARFPSTDEFAQALRGALGGDAALVEPAVPWMILEQEGFAYQLQSAVDALQDGGELSVEAPAGSGVTTLLRRLAWSAGLRGLPVVFLERGSAALSLIEEELELAARPGALVIVDRDRGELAEVLSHVQRKGARLVLARGASSSASGSALAPTFRIPPLKEASVRRLLSVSLPSFPEGLVPLLMERTEGRPGALRAFVDAAVGEPLASARDVDAVLSGVQLGSSSPLHSAELSLERGHYGAAAQHLAQLDDDGPHVCWLRARLELAAGSAELALSLTERAIALAESETERQKYVATQARAQLGLGQYEPALALLEQADAFEPVARAEALAYRGLGQTLTNQQEAAVQTLKLASSFAEEAGSDRVRALCRSSLATAEWRVGDLGAAEVSYREAIRVASASGDAGILSSSLINLAGLLKERGELAESIRVLESAVDAARRAGRLASLHQALLNLSNADLYLGRLERARAQLTRVGDFDALPQASRAQLHGLRAELHLRTGEDADALAEFALCENAWKALGRHKDAGEAALEAALHGAAILLDPKRPQGAFVPSVAEVEAALGRGRELVSDEAALLFLAEARVRQLVGQEAPAETLAEKALALATANGQREWAWRASALLAELAESAGKSTRAKRAREEAVEILEEIGARLPDDLRAVFWNDPRRAHLRQESADRASGFDSRVPQVPRARASAALSGSDALSRLSQTPLERRLARILAVNSDLAGEVDLPRLSEKIVAHAAELLRAERAFLLLGTEADALEICAARGGQGAEHEEFSRSIARQVLESGRPLVSIDAERDGRLRAFQSVHLSLVTAVACVPVLSPQGSPIGALYLEARTEARPDFGEELSTLQAFADQAAIALETSRLLRSLEDKSEALRVQNESLMETRARLKESLGRRTERLREVRRELVKTKRDLASTSSFAGLVGTSAPMRRIYSLIERIADTDVPVLITGESGTGKEVVARAIHQSSVRAKKNLLAVNCGAIPETILESELFGHTRGAFTGADRERKGLFRDADGGVLFLDEIGETPLKMQAGLLRVLQEGRVRPVGGAEEVPIDVRVIFATNRNLEAAVASGAFREDLLYRIRVVEIELPPLRERQEDIVLLANHFLDRFAVRFGADRKTLSREALSKLTSHPLPGNVRQLENVLLNGWVLSEGDQIEADDLALPLGSRTLPPNEALRDGAHPVSNGPAAPPKKGTLSEHQRSEKSEIISALEQTGWNRAKAAEQLGMARRTFYRRLKDYGLQ